MRQNIEADLTKLAKVDEKIQSIQADYEEKAQALKAKYEAEALKGEEEFQRKFVDFLQGQKDFPRTILLKRQTELQEMLQKNIQFKQESLNELKQTEELLIAPLRTRLSEAIATVAREQRLALVINTDANACPFIEPTMGVNVTEAVMQIIER